MEKSPENIPTLEEKKPIGFIISDMEEAGVFEEIVNKYNDPRLTVDIVVHDYDNYPTGDPSFLEHKVIDKIHGWHGKDEDELSIDEKKEIIIETFKEILEDKLLKLKNEKEE